MTTAGGWPALAYARSPVAGSSTPQNTVAHIAPGSWTANRSRALSVCAGSVFCSSSARQALRS
jgi:hypothetical protein